MFFIITGCIKKISAGAGDASALIDQFVSVVNRLCLLPENNGLLIGGGDDTVADSLVVVGLAGRDHITPLVLLLGLDGYS